MEKTTYQQSTCYLAQSCAAQFSRHMDILLKPYGLTSAQYKILDILKHFGSMTAADLCKHTNMDTGAMTRMLDRLEDKGSIERYYDADDRRLRMVSISKDTLKSLKKMDAIMDGFNESSTLLSKADLKQLNQLLTKLDYGLAKISQK